MSDSSPADLAVAFRSFARRLRDSLDGADPEHQAAARALVPNLDAAVGRAASALGVGDGGDVGATGNAIAHKISSTAPGQWDDAVLASLRAAALEAGTALRSITAAAGS